VQAIIPTTTHLSVAWSVCLSVCRLSRSCTLLKPLDRCTCHLPGTLVRSSDTVCLMWVPDSSGVGQIQGSNPHAKHAVSCHLADRDETRFRLCPDDVGPCHLVCMSAGHSGALRSTFDRRPRACWCRWIRWSRSSWWVISQATRRVARHSTLSVDAWVPVVSVQVVLAVVEVAKHRVNRRPALAGPTALSKAPVWPTYLFIYWLATLRAMSDPYCWAVSVSVCLSAARLVLRCKNVWLSGLVVSALGIRARWPGFESRVVPLFHWVATLSKLFTHVASPLSQLQETGVQQGSFRRLVIKCARLS